MFTLIQRLSRKPYAREVAAFWAMKWFHIAGPMNWTGQMFEGEATAFIVITEAVDHLISVSFHDSQGEAVDPKVGSLEESERLVDALVLRILQRTAEQGGSASSAP